MVHLDPVIRKTVIYPREDMPVKGDRTFGLLFADDVNRGEKGAQAGLMELVNTRRLNGYVMPDTWGVLAASNPAGKQHAVKGQDQAQASRWVSILYSPSRDKSFVGQLQIQGVDVAFTGYCMKFKHIAPVPSSAGILPDVPYTNFRNVTMIGHLYGVLKHLPRAWQEVAFSNLGPNEMANLQAMLTGELPLSPQELLGITARERKLGEVGETPAKAWELAKPRLLAMHKEGRTDLVAVTVHALVRHLNNEQFDVSDDQLDVLGELWTTLPKEAAHDALRRLVLVDAPRNAYYKPKFTGWKSPDGVKPGPLSHYFVNLLAEVRAQLKEGLGRQAS